MDSSSPALGPSSTVRPTAARSPLLWHPDLEGERGRGRMQPWSVGMDGVTMADLVRGSQGGIPSNWGSRGGSSVHLQSAAPISESSLSIGALPGRARDVCKIAP